MCDKISMCSKLFLSFVVHKWNYGKIKLTANFYKPGCSITYRTTNKTEYMQTVKINLNCLEFTKLNCLHCNKFYFEQKGCSFKPRYSEHMKALHSSTKSTFVTISLNQITQLQTSTAIWKSYTNVKDQTPRNNKELQTQRYMETTF